jgi:glucosyl-dolichyl phosphate glucuronosyltransferase
MQRTVSIAPPWSAARVRAMISVVLCTYNRARRLKAALASFRNMQLPPELAWEMIIVDNNSTDGTATVVSEYQRTAPFDVRYFFERKQGHSHARNRGIVESKGVILAFTDDDVIMDAHWLEQLQHTYDRFDCLGVGGRIAPVWACAKPAWLQEDGPYALMDAIISFDQGDSTCVLKTPPFGANMSFRRTAFEQYGLFRTDLGRVGARLAGGDDTEFGKRLLRNNERLIYNSRVLVYHPVEKERATKEYFQRWYFEYGRTSMRQREVPRGGLQRLRLPTTSLHSLCESLFLWTIAVNPKRRLYYRLHVCESLGRLREVCSRSGSAERPMIPRLAESHISRPLPSPPAAS